MVRLVMEASRSPWPRLPDPVYCGPRSEKARLGVLGLYDIESLLDDPELNEIRAFAAELCDTPISLVSLVEEDRQLFLSKQGVDVSETPRNTSFCQYAMLEEQIMQVPDATLDNRFANTALVTGEPHIRFYAGAPIISREGAPMGTLCVIDKKPRKHGLTDHQRRGLEVLADAAVRRLESRRRELERTAGQIEAKRLLDESQRQFDNLADALPQMAWSTDADGIPDYFNERWYEFTGTKQGDHFSDNWTELLHVDDRERAANVWQEAVTSGDPYEVEYRLRRADGEYVWTLARGLPVKDSDGNIIRWFGTNTDIQKTRLLIESQDLLSRELSHRIKNIFSVVSGLVSFASRGNPQLRDLAATLSDRIAALGRAHNYVRPMADQPASTTSLKALLADLFAPYDLDGESRVHIKGDDIMISERDVTPLALAFHELATNAVKYGGLSTDDGHAKIEIADDNDALIVHWTECGGPEISGEPDANGFGSDLIHTSIVRQLKGEVTRKWEKSGLVVHMKIPKERLSDN